MKTYIAYYRISTLHQLGDNNISLGIEAQRTAVKNFVGSSGNILKEFIEIESGKKSNRPILAEAIKEAQLTKSIVITHKIDRMSRNLSFLLALKDKGIDFITVDMPELNLFSLSILGALAQHERELISSRTKNALAELKKQGIRLGKPENMTSEARAKGIKVIKNKARNDIRNRQATAVILNCIDKRMRLIHIAEYLNKLGYKTSKENQFTAMGFKRLYQRFINDTKMAA